MKDHVIICGLGSIGFRTFELLNQANQKVVAVSSTMEDEWRWQVEARGGIFILGDARDDTLLIQAGIKEAKAILVMTDQDIVNVAIAMDARKLNPQIKIILRMFDNELGAHITKALDLHQVFSTSELAAPIFASGIFDKSAIAQFKMKGKEYLVSEESGTSNDLNADSIVLTEHRTYSKKLVAHLADTYKITKKNKLLKYVGKFNYLRSPVFANFRRFLFILFCVILASALVLKWAMPLSYIDALYFVTTTVTTVGYGDFNFSQSPSFMKFFGCLLMLTGAASLAILFSSITEIILSKKLPSILGGRPVPKKNHVIVVGAGPVGQKLVSLLLEDQLPIVVMEGGKKDHYAQDINHKVALVDGYLRSRDTLKRANVESARAILVMTEDDVENLSVSLAAKKLNPSIINIIHVFSPKLGEKLKTSLSLDKVLCLPTIIAPYFAAAVFGDEILLALEWENQLIFLSHEGNNEDESTEYSIRINGVRNKEIKVHVLALSS